MMYTRRYKLALDDNKEYIFTGDTLHIRNVGSLLAGFLSIDWTALKISYKHLVEQAGSSDFRPWIEDLRWQIIQENHPALDYFLRAYLPDTLSMMSNNTQALEAALRTDGDIPRLSDTVAHRSAEAMQGFIDGFAAVKTDLVPLADEVYSPSEQVAALPIQRRYIAMRWSCGNYQKFAAEQYAKLDTNMICIEDGHEIDIRYSGCGTGNAGEYVGKAAGRKKLVFPLARATDDLGALMIWEFDYMATHGLPMRRCSICNKYFIPYSTTSCYCNRLLGSEDKRTCKDIGAALTYKQKIENDHALALYKTVNNRLQMWVRRHGEYCPQATVPYADWQRMAQDLLASVRSGKISYDEYAAAIDCRSEDIFRK